MKILTGFVFLSFVFAAQGQRVAVDFTSALDNAYTTLVYCHIVKPGLYLKTGFSFGNYGRGVVTKDFNEVLNGSPLVAPYAAMNTSPFPGMLLAEYDSKHTGSGIELGIGKFFELGPVHTLRLDFQVKGYRLSESYWATYSTTLPDTIIRFNRFDFRRNTLSIGPEIFHAIRLTGRLTFYYGLKIPYWVPLRTKGYRARDMKSQAAGFQPNLSIGMSCAISRRNKETPE